MPESTGVGRHEPFAEGLLGWGSQQAFSESHVLQNPSTQSLRSLYRLDVGWRLYNRSSVEARVGLNPDSGDDHNEQDAAGGRCLSGILTHPVNRSSNGATAVICVPWGFRGIIDPSR